MCLLNTEKRYGDLAIFFHWVLFFLIATMLIIGFTMGGVEDKVFKGQLYFLHKSFGILILMLSCFSILWAMNNAKPRLPDHMSVATRSLARVVQTALFILLLAMPLSGLIMSSAAGKPSSFFGLFQIILPISGGRPFAHFMGYIHEVLAWTIIALASLHTIGALVHHHIYKDDVLKRMLPERD